MTRPVMRVGRTMCKNGALRTPEYDIWYHMIRRCHHPGDKDFKSYGCRGITVCDRWRNSFEAFYRDMGVRPTPQHSIDRKNNNGNYEPENCHWATKTEQSRNRRNCTTVSIVCSGCGVEFSLVTHLAKKRSSLSKHGLFCKLDCWKANRQRLRRPA